MTDRRGAGRRGPALRPPPRLGTRFPSSAGWRIVSSNRITPLTNASTPGVVIRRVTSVESTPTARKRFSIVGFDSSAARIPLPGATSARAVASRVSTGCPIISTPPFPGRPSGPASGEPRSSDPSARHRPRCDHGPASTSARWSSGRAVLGQPQLVVTRPLAKHAPGTAGAAHILAADASPVGSASSALHADTVPTGPQLMPAIVFGHSCTSGPCSATLVVMEAAVV